MMKFACIPAYNEENTISELVKSAKNYVDKVIVCDDGSEVCDEADCPVSNAVMIGFGEVTDSMVEVTYDTNADIAGFQFTVSGLTLLSADGGAAADSGFTVSVGSTTGIVIGFAFDGDGDRVGLITNAGEMIFPDKQMMLFSEDILKNQKGPIVFDVKCSNHLSNLILKNGGTPIMAPTGHFHIKKAIKKNNALLGGEMSGHIFFNDKWYGFDDGPYAAVRAAEILAKSNRSIAEIFGDFPESFSTPELNITVTDENKFEIIDRFMANSNIDGDKILIDGLRVNFNDGWGLLRASNTTPKLVLRFEGDTKESMNRIQNEFIAELSRICPEIDINLD